MFSVDKHELSILTQGMIWWLNYSCSQIYPASIASEFFIILFQMKLKYINISIYEKKISLVAGDSLLEIKLCQR